RVAVALGLGGDLLLERRGALLELDLLVPQRQEVARAHAELVMIDRAQKEVGGPGLERLVAQVAVLVSGDDDHRYIGASRDGAEAADELGAVELRHVEIGDEEVRRRRGPGVE